jgi:asparagine synthase (glutamine-hydrolysing)
MCAIVGLLSARTGCEGLIRKMTTLLRHRGPDDEGYLLADVKTTNCFGGEETPASVFATDMPYRPLGKLDSDATCRRPTLAFGHRRLSILDLSPLGHQPMCYQGRYWIVYNGEVYNYLELRAELGAAGHRFLSLCDTEVILAAYAQWGTGCFSRFNGMWAMAIYDAQDQTLVLSRDRFGVKPLYYWSTGELFAFASEIKAFTCLPGWRARLNGQAVHDFLLSGLQDHSRQTLFADVLQLEPGWYAKIDCALPGTDKSLELHSWYQIAPAPFAGDFEEASARFRELLIDSVRLRLRSDVPVGSCLSGGLDSSSIVCAAHELLKAQGGGSGHKTFSACSDLERYDERRFIKLVVEATRVEPHYVFPAADVLIAEMDRVIWHQDEPFAGTSIYAQWCVFRSAAEQRIKVMLDGQGADESLCGYYEFRRAFLCGLLREGHSGRTWREALALSHKSSRALQSLWRAAADALIPVAVQRNFRGFRRNRRPPPWLDPSALGASFPGHLVGRFQQPRSARELSLNLLTGAHLQMLLHWEDRNSMAHSIESRVPFLDYRLVEFVTGLPAEYKIRAGASKAILRKGMAGLVPAGILERQDKMAFVTPEAIWATKEGRDAFRDRLAAALERTKGVIPIQATRLLEDAVAGRTAYNSAVWRIIALGAWIRLFNVFP